MDDRELALQLLAEPPGGGGRRRQHTDEQEARHGPPSAPGPESPRPTEVDVMSRAHRGTLPQLASALRDVAQRHATVADDDESGPEARRGEVAGVDEVEHGAAQ